MEKILKALYFFGCVIYATITSWFMGLVLALAIMLLLAIGCIFGIWHLTWCQAPEDNIFGLYWILSVLISILIGTYRVYQEFKE